MKYYYGLETACLFSSVSESERRADRHRCIEREEEGEAESACALLSMKDSTCGGWHDRLGLGCVHHAGWLSPALTWAGGSFDSASDSHHAGYSCCRVWILCISSHESYRRTIVGFIEFQKLDIMFNPHLRLRPPPNKPCLARGRRLFPCVAPLCLMSSFVSHPDHVFIPCLNSARPARPLHDGARDRDAAALVAVALDALGLAGAAARLGGLDDALDGRDGCCAGTVGHFCGCWWCLGGLRLFCCSSDAAVEGCCFGCWAGKKGL